MEHLRLKSKNVIVALTEKLEQEQAAHTTSREVQQELTELLQKLQMQLFSLQHEEAPADVSA